MKSSILLLLTSIFCLGLHAAEPVLDPLAYAPMRVIQTDAAVFPHAAKDVGLKNGEVHVTVQIDEAGKLVDTLVTASTFPAFAETAVNALKRWRYEPAHLHGEPHSATSDLTFMFESEGVAVVGLTASSYVEMRSVQYSPQLYAYRACTMRQLDRIPTPTKVVRPVIPDDAVKQNLSGTITVQFFIDEKGHVRMPAVSRQTGETNAVLSAAAVAAVSEWEFEPPLSKGKPVLVAARQDFNFTPTP